MSSKFSIKNIAATLESHYLEENILGDFVYLSIDPKKIYKLFGKEHSFRNLIDVIAREWGDSADRNEIYPSLALSVASLQIAISFKEADDSSGPSIDSLSEQFIVMLGYPEYHVLMKRLFVGRGSNEIGYTYQERLWESVKKFWKEKHNKTLLLPKPKNYRNRYLQFPLSQILVTHNELLKMLPLFSSLGISPDDDIGWEYVRDKIFSRWKSSREHLSIRLTKFFKEEKADQMVPLYCQLFLRYLQDVYAFGDQANDHKTAKAVREMQVSQRRLMLEFIRGGKILFYRYYPISESYSELDRNQLKNIFIRNNHLLFEENDPQYGQYKEVKHVVSPSKPLVLIVRMRRADVIKQRINKNYSIEEGNIYSIDQSLTAIRFKGFQEFSIYFKEQSYVVRKKIALYPRYGLKVGYRTYLQGCGPTIVDDEGEKMMNIQLRRIGFSDFSGELPDQLPPGGYQIRSNDTYRSFTIISENKGPIEEEHYGFNFSNWSYTDITDQVEAKGLLLNISSNSVGRVRAWINQYLLENRGIDINALTQND